MRFRAPYRHPLISIAAILMATIMLSLPADAQNDSDQVERLQKRVEQLTDLVSRLETRMEALEDRDSAVERNSAALVRSTNGGEDAAKLVRAAAELRGARTQPSPSEPSLQQSAAPAQAAASTAASPLPGTLPGGATLNYYLDGYFENNFNNPVGRVNDLRAYDVLSRTFSLNQADFIFALDPDLKAERRYGIRLDLQFGQATETLQGNPANEPRPEIYRNIFQAYGTYIVPIGTGLTVDAGKWASSLGIEGNYAKDQMNYSRSFYFDFLPFYHQGARLHYNFNDKFGVNYWIVNGTNQSEPTNGYKDELFGLALQPAKTVSWTINYYLGQEHPDTIPATNCVVPVQPGLCFAPLTPAPNGKVHIFDSYVTWNATPKLTFAGEADYVIQREWANAAPGESSAPTHDDGGVGYVQYQFSPRHAIAARAEYLSDRGGAYSNVSQALKEATGTYRYTVSDSFMLFLEYRRDWSNVPYFVTSNPAAPSTHQDTLGAGLVWWYGGKEGAW
jgi:hypothetical protein